MARPLKQGIDYFPYDTDLDQDDKLGMIIGEFGEKGERLWTKLLCWIYKNDGYYVEWNEDAQLRFLRRYSYCGFSMSFIDEVVPRFVKWGLFDKTVFNAFQIFTSVRIQSTWLDATRKRKIRVIDPKIWLLEVNGGVKAEETQKKAEVIDKGKESKVKESKGEEIPRANDFSNSNLFRQPKIPDWKEVHRVFLSQGGTEEMAKKFFDQNEAVGWFYKGSPVTNFASQVPGYIKTWKENLETNVNGKPNRGRLKEAVKDFNA